MKNGGKGTIDPLSVHTGVALLVKSGWPPDYVLDMEIPVFQDYLKVVQKAEVHDRIAFYYDTLSAIGTVFGKDSKPEKYAEGLLDTVKG